jgi:hypothetical protein
MKEKTQELLDQVEEQHDWDDHGVRGGGGTYLSNIYVCRCCGLTKKWENDTQNNIEDRHTFSDFRGNAITLLEASEMECCPEPVEA